MDEGSSMGLGLRTASSAASSASTPIDSSNIGFQLLKKHGWKEGTGLGVDEQGRLEPVQAFVKKNKRGLGADKPKKINKHSKTNGADDPKVPKSKAKKISKKMKKMQELEKRLQEKEFDRAFFREFWPDNV
ncbi:D111/G-patch domain-containing family protein [Striga asiatica]|uniref:D111/G-patch domain-containing family protein n=1 Tax=Striga asiatica TaxID=4170 RepID=A0A5A7P533_STRAF|nr:D111/G-patch domain-containing family protein [Striga asiatica]